MESFLIQKHIVRKYSYFCMGRRSSLITLVYVSSRTRTGAFEKTRFYTANLLQNSVDMFSDITCDMNHVMRPAICIYIDNDVGYWYNLIEVSVLCKSSRHLRFENCCLYMMENIFRSIFLKQKNNMIYIMSFWVISWTSTHWFR